VGDPFQQLHDFEPGIAPSNLFWTVPISPSAIIVNPEKGTATLRARDLSTRFPRLIQRDQPKPVLFAVARQL
jgi:hypothetical protein